MIKFIDSDIIIGKALIYSGLECLSFEQIYQYLNIVGVMLPEGYIISGYGYNAIESFFSNYTCIVTRIHDKIVLKENKNHQIIEFLETVFPEINEISKRATDIFQDSSSHIIEDEQKKDKSLELLYEKKKY